MDIHSKVDIDAISSSSFKVKPYTLYNKKFQFWFLHCVPILLKFNLGLLDTPFLFKRISLPKCLCGDDGLQDFLNFWTSIAISSPFNKTFSLILLGCFSELEIIQYRKISMWKKTIIPFVFFPSENSFVHCLC